MTWHPSTPTHTISRFCTNFNMAEATTSDVRASKRKRAQVNYYEEIVSDDEMLGLSEVDEEEEDVKKSARAKVRALHPLRSRPTLYRTQTY